MRPDGRRHGGLRRLVVLLTALTVIAAACGGADESETPEAAVAAEAPVSESEESASAAAPAGEAVTEDEPDPAAEDAGAGGQESDGGPAPEGGLRTVETSFGTVEVPADPERIIALDAISAVNLLSVGAEPSIVFDINGAASLRRVLGDRGIDVRDDLGDGFTTLNVEAIASEQPDLILITAVEGFDDLLAPLFEVAPTVVLPFGSTWSDAVADVAAIVGSPGAADRLTVAMEGLFEDASVIVAAEPYSLSILGSTFGLVASMAPEAAVSVAAQQVGVTRPIAQVEDVQRFGGQPIIQLSEEVLGDHDADWIAVLDGQFYDSAGLMDVPTFQTLSAAQAGNVVLVEGDLWFAGHAFAVYWQLTDLAAIATGDVEAVGTVDDALERWDAYLQLISG